MNQAQAPKKLEHTNNPTMKMEQVESKVFIHNMVETEEPGSE